MAIATNKQTQQPALTSDTSSVKCILAGRAYVKDCTSPVTTAVAPVAGKAESTTPSGWTDLGAVMRSKVTMEYVKEYSDVRTGLDGVYYASYVTAKSCSWSFALDQYDATVLALLTGKTKGTGYITSSTQIGYRFWIGKEDLVEKQLLLIGTNKLDEKEHQYWTPQADLRFSWEEDGDAIVIRVTAMLRSNTYSQDAYGDTTLKSFYQVTIWD
jgi:hypothetical protein